MQVLFCQLVHHLLGGSCWCTFSLIMSSMRRIETAASVAKRSDLILLIAGSTTPALRLSRTSPSHRSSPENLSCSLPSTVWLV